MLRNYLVVAVRNLMRHKTYSLINIVGLAVGMACCLLIYMFVRYEWTYDTFHQDADRTFLARVDYNDWTVTPPVLAPTLAANFPQVERVVRLGLQGRETVVHHDDRSFVRSGLYADSNVFDVFSFPHVSGDPQTALQDIRGVVVSRETARIFFGDEDPLGMPLTIQSQRGPADHYVRGVVDVPENSSIQFDFLLPLDLRGKLTDEWQQWQVHTFVQLAKGATATALETELIEFFTSELHTPTSEDFGTAKEPLLLLPLTDIHLSSDLVYRLGQTSNPLYSYILTGVALALLLMACVNYTNLSIGLSTTRVREIGMRKVMGATRGQIGKQFQGEALVVCVLGLAVGAALATALLPEFSRLSGKSWAMEYATLWPLMLGLVTVVGVIAGSFPGAVLSRMYPANALKSRFLIGGPTTFSRSLVVLQLSCSIALITAVMTMEQQIGYLRARDLGFDAEQVVAIDTGGYRSGFSVEDRKSAVSEYRRLAAAYPGVLSVSAANISFASPSQIEARGVTYRDRRERISYFKVDYDYLATLGAELAEGRDFSREHRSDTGDALLVNEALVRYMGWDSGVGRTPQILRPGSENFGKAVVGVVHDFHYRPLQDPIRPAVFHLNSDTGHLRYLFVRVASGNLQATLSLLRDGWSTAFPERPFAYSFLDQEVDRTFRASGRWITITRYAALFAIAVACLGVFGLTSLAVSRASREIGIRKVVGASVASIVSMFSREYVSLVVAASILSCPAAYYVMSRWLDDFAYRMPLGPEMFIVGAVSALVIVLLTVGLRTVRAATANAVDTLRSE